MRLVRKMFPTTSSVYTFLIVLLSLAAFGNSGRLKCFVCSRLMGTDCDFLEYIEDPGRYLKACENPIVQNKTVSAKCHVEITSVMGVRYTNRTCGPVSCPDGMKCCDCKKKGCNGNNKCNFYSSTAKWYPTKLLITILSICWLSFYQLEIY